MARRADGNEILHETRTLFEQAARPADLDVADRAREEPRELEDLDEDVRGDQVSAQPSAQAAARHAPSHDFSGELLVRSE